MNVILSRSQKLKYENWERSKLQAIHERLLNEEDRPDIKGIITNILGEINEVIHFYKQ